MALVFDDSPRHDVVGAFPHQRTGVDRVTEAFAFDDILLVPEYSTVLPTEVDTTTRLTRAISLNIPLISAAMNTVTEAKMAIAMAQQGGIGVIHKNLSISEQAEQVFVMRIR